MTSTTSTKKKKRTAKTKSSLPFDNKAATVLALDFKKHPDDNDRGGAFYSVMKPMVDAALLKFAPREDDSTRDDLAQDALLKLMRNLRYFTPKKGTLFSWSTRIVKNMTLDYFRRKKDSITVEALDGVPDVVPRRLEVNLEGLSEIKSFFPFYVSTRVFNELFAVIEHHKFQPTERAVAGVTVIFRKNKIPYHKYGTLQEITQFLIMLTRAWFLDSAPIAHEKLEEAIIRNGRLDAVRALAHYLPPKMMATVLHICGGMTVKFPTPRGLLNKRKKTR